ncbi:MAG: DUF362 domain-containing protein [Anaerolineae bacterium]
MSEVVFIKTKDRAAGVQAAMALMPLPDVEDKSVFLKPNLNSADPTPGSTHPDVLRSLVRALQEGGARQIVVGDRSGMGNTRQVFEQRGVFAMAEELGFEAMVLDELEAAQWQSVEMPEGHWQRGYAIARPVLDADVVVQTCCLKTHRYGGHFTLSLKNSVGLVAKRIPGEPYDYMRELHTSRHQRLMIAEANTAYAPDWILMDGIEAFTLGGPARGELVEPGLVLAGSDRVALDAVGVAVLRHFGTTGEVERGTIFEQEQIARAVELGLGVTSADQIELVTDGPESAAYADQIREVLLAG